MARLLATMGAAMAAMVLVGAACGDGYEEQAVTPTPTPGAIDGECYANSTCNDGLSCVVVAGRARCRPAAEAIGDASSSETSSGSVPVENPSLFDGGSDADADAASENACRIETPYPCPEQKACFGADVQCIGKGTPCNGNSWGWECESRAECEGSSTACCLSEDIALAGFNDCSVSTFPVQVNTVYRTECKSSCGKTRLCRTDADCKDIGDKCRRFTMPKDAPQALQGRIFGLCIVAP